MSEDLKKEVQEAPLLWPLTPIPTFEEVYDPKICTEASREISTVFEGWLHPKPMSRLKNVVPPLNGHLTTRDAPQRPLKDLRVVRGSA